MNTFNSIYPNGSFVPYFNNGIPTAETAAWLSLNKIPARTYDEIASIPPQTLTRNQIRIWACLNASVNRVGRTEYRAYLRDNWIWAEFNKEFALELCGNAENVEAYKRLFL